MLIATDYARKMALDMRMIDPTCEDHPDNKASHCAKMITQVCPGALAINMSSLLGYKLAKTPGAIVCTLGASLPSCLIILAIAMFFHQFEDNKVIAAMFAGIRPAVVALIAVPTFSLAKSAGISLVNCWIPILSALLRFK